MSEIERVADKSIATDEGVFLRVLVRRNKRPYSPVRPFNDRQK